MTPSWTTGVAMLLPPGSGVRQAGLRFETLFRVISFSGLKLWPS
jgi:hypothetical protein